MPEDGIAVDGRRERAEEVAAHDLAALGARLFTQTAGRRRPQR